MFRPTPLPPLASMSDVVPEGSPYPPVDMKTAFLGGLFLLAMLAACYVAAAIILPVFLAVVLKLVLQPIVGILEKMHIPSKIGAVIVMLLLFGGFFGLGAMLSSPAAKWAQQLPEGITKIQAHLRTLTAPIKSTQNVLQHAEGLAIDPQTQPVTVAIQGSRISDRLLTNTQGLVSGIGETILVLFFLLGSGDLFLRRFIEILPRFQDKRQTVLITQQVESDISAYLAIITLANAVVGIMTAAMMAYAGLDDPILWGVVAFLLNYIPILGPIIGAGIFTIAGILSEGSVSVAFLPAIFYLVIHVVEGMILTPSLLAKRFTLNPVLVILSVIFWFWMWGVPGAILATPMLAVTKIICDRIQSLMPFGHFIEG